MLLMLFKRMHISLLLMHCPTVINKVKVFDSGRQVIWNLKILYLFH